MDRMSQVVNTVHDNGWIAFLGLFGVALWRALAHGQMLGGMKQVQVDQGQKLDDQGKKIDYLVERFDNFIDGRAKKADRAGDQDGSSGTI